LNCKALVTRVTKALQLSSVFCIVWGLLGAVILAVSAPTLVTFFNQNPDVVRIASQYLWIVPISYAGAGIILVSSSAFNALGKPIPSVVMTIVRMFVLYIPLAYFGGQLYGVNGIFAAACISNFIVGIGAYLWNQRTCSAKAAKKAEVV
ncbi:MAG: MATE family efflux transporter, partial [Cyanobacteria bacterium J06636_27]